jgi:hypothetical protein
MYSIGTIDNSIINDSIKTNTSLKDEIQKYVRGKFFQFENNSF